MAPAEESSRKRQTEPSTPADAKQSSQQPKKSSKEKPSDVIPKKTKPLQQRKKKEVIDYSAAQAEKSEGGTVIAGGNSVDADPKSKVRSWLLASDCRVARPITALPKSKSTPVGLTSPGMMSTPAALTSPVAVPGGRGPPRPRQVTLRRLADPKSRSVGSLGRSDASRMEKVRLQVVYKPPFKFSLKLRKADKVGQLPARNSGPRTGVLVRTTTDAKKKEKKRSIGKTRQAHAPSKLSNASCIVEPPSSDLHTVPSDLEVLLSESEFLFSDA